MKKSNKIITAILFFIVAFLSLGSMLIDFYVTALKLWHIWACIAELIALTVFNFIIWKRKKVIPIIYTVCVCLISLILLCYAYLSPFWNNRYFSKDYTYTVAYDTEISSEQAIEDVDEFMQLLKRYHPAFINEVPFETSKAYGEAVSYILGKGSVKECELSAQLSYIASTLHDAHTSITSNYSSNYYLKDLVQRNTDNWYLVGANGISLKTLFSEKYCKYFSYEAESWGIKSFGQKFISLSGLAFLGIDSNNFSLTWEKDGISETVSYNMSDFISASEYSALYQASNKNKNSSTDWISYTINDEQNVAILTLSQCNYNQELIQKYSEFFTEVKNRNIGNVIVDLRKNGGGNSLVANEFIRYLPVESFSDCNSQIRCGLFILGSTEPQKSIVSKYDNLTFDGDLYLLTSNSTFSSAMMFAEYIKDNNLGTIVGEAPGNAANGYGDISLQQLKNSKIMVSISTKIFTRASGDLSNDFVIPDYECNGNDALDKAYEIISQKLG